MIKYGMDAAHELIFAGFQARIEKRDSQWIDIWLKPELAESSLLPADIIDFSILVIATPDGQLVQSVALDEDCDCEYSFTPSEKEQIAAFIRQEGIQRQICEAAVPQEGKLW